LVLVRRHGVRQVRPPHLVGPVGDDGPGMGLGAAQMSGPLRGLKTSSRMGCRTRSLKVLCPTRGAGPRPFGSPPRGRATWSEYAACGLSVRSQDRDRAALTSWFRVAGDGGTRRLIGAGL
jgi:hypothetical protein